MRESVAPEVLAMVGKLLVAPTLPKQQLAALSVLVSGPKSAREVVRTATRDLGHHIAESGAYVLMHRLEGKGFVEASMEEKPRPKPGGRRRRVYRLTAEGRSALEQATIEYRMSAKGLAYHA